MGDVVSFVIDCVEMGYVGLGDIMCIAGCQRKRPALIGLIIVILVDEVIGQFCSWYGNAVNAVRYRHWIVSPPGMQYRADANTIRNIEAGANHAIAVLLCQRQIGDTRWNVYVEFF